MLITIDVSSYYEWDPAPEGYTPTEEETLGLLYKPSSNGGWLKKTLIEDETHTAINIPETEFIDAEESAQRLGRTFNRTMHVATLLDQHVMKHHAPSHAFLKISVHDDPAMEAALNATLVPVRKSSGGGSGGSPKARPFQRRAGRNFGEGGSLAMHSHFFTEVRDAEGRVKHRGKWRHNLTTDTAVGYTNRRDWQAKAMGGGLGAFFGATAVGAATATGATSLTNAGAAFPTASQGLSGMVVAVGPNAAGAGATVFGVIMSNTATVLTVDQWYNPATGAAGATPNATGNYQIIPGQFPAMFLAVTSDAGAPTSADTTLTTEATTNGFARAIATWAHTAAATTYTLTKTFTASGTLTVNKEAVFAACNPAGGGAMPFESAEPSPPTLVSGDTLAQTVTITIN